MNDLRLWVVGCARDCGKYLPSVFQNVNQLRPWFADVQLRLLENDSQDDTVDQIRTYAAVFDSLRWRQLPGLEQQGLVRTERMAHLRNALLAWIRSDCLWSASDLVLMLDWDEVNAQPWQVEHWPELLRAFLSRPQQAAVFANQKGPYYDLWALRHVTRMPHDPWQRVFDLHCRQPLLSDQELIERAYLPLVFTLDPKSSPESVESAFGGLGFYKASWLDRNRSVYSGVVSRWLGESDYSSRLIRWQVAEHVSFHAGLRALGGSLWICPSLINWTTADLPDLRPNPKAWRYLSCTPML